MSVRGKKVRTLKRPLSLKNFVAVVATAVLVLAVAAPGVVFAAGGHGGGGAHGGFGGHPGFVGHSGHPGHFRGSRGFVVVAPGFGYSPYYPYYAPDYSDYAPAPSGYWYYCPSAGAYYPYVGSCPEAWVPVPPG
jgi:hypothetical protein